MFLLDLLGSTILASGCGYLLWKGARAAWRDTVTTARAVHAAEHTNPQATGYIPVPSAPLRPEFSPPTELILQLMEEHPEEWMFYPKHVYIYSGFAIWHKPTKTVLGLTKNSSYSTRIRDTYTVCQYNSHSANENIFTPSESKAIHLAWEKLSAARTEADRRYARKVMSKKLAAHIESRENPVPTMESQS